MISSFFTHFYCGRRKERLLLDAQWFQGTFYCKTDKSGSNNVCEQGSEAQASPAAHHHYQQRLSSPKESGKEDDDEAKKN